MRRFFSVLISILIGLPLIVLAVANRQPVILNLLPEGLQDLSPVTYQVSVPLFLVILLGALLGLLIGFVWEFIREYRQRSDANRKQREVKRLRREVKRLKEQVGEEQDDILALLEDT